MDGLLIIDKPIGKTSHDIVHSIRRITGEKRVGHAGTLDPIATGVLVIGMGQGVRISEYLTNHDKVYDARVKLGVETDTYDATGRVLETRAFSVTPSQVQIALDAFVGKILQSPPSFSAIQVGGVRQYKLARRGEIIELEPRPIEIYSIRTIALTADEIEFRVACSKGTYIRSLAHDLGVNLGCGAHLVALRRLASGPFTIEQAHTLDEVRDGFAQGEGARLLLPLDRGLMEFDAMQLTAEELKLVSSGRVILGKGDTKTQLVRAYAPDGTCIALLQAADGVLKPHKVFYTDSHHANTS